MRISIVVFPGADFYLSDVQEIVDNLKAEILLNGIRVGATHIAGVDPISQLKSILDSMTGADAVLVYDGQMSVIATGTVQLVAACSQLGREGWAV